MPVSEEHEGFIHCSCQNVLVRLALQKSCGICFQDRKKSTSGHLNPIRKLQHCMLEFTTCPHARAKEPHLISFLPLTQWNKRSSLTNPPDIPFPLCKRGIWTWFVPALLFQKCASSKWGEQEKGSKKFVLFSKQAVSRWIQDTGPNLLPPPPPPHSPPSSEICLGGRRRRWKGWEQLPLAAGKVWPLSAHLNMTTPCKHTLKAELYSSVK